MKKFTKWTVATVIATSATLAPAAIFASDERGYDNAAGPSAQSLSQYDEEFTANSLVREGSQGGIVVAIQQELNDRGIATNVDGIYGPQTKNSVELFQNHYNLSIDGVVGPQTWDFMFSVE